MSDEVLAVDIRTAAKMLGISVRHLGTLVRRGQIPSVTIGRRRLFVVAQLRSWLVNKSGGDGSGPR